MFNRIKAYFTGFDPKGVYIRQMKNGKFRLLVNGNEVVGTYSTNGNALRALRKRGLKLTDA